MVKRTAQPPNTVPHQPRQSAGTPGVPVDRAAAPSSAAPAPRLDRWRAARDRMAAPAATH